MAINEILPFAPDARESQGDILSQEEYAKDNQRLIGQAGLARRALNNKALRQANHMAAGVAQFIANRGTDVKDDADLGKVESGLEAAIEKVVDLPSIEDHISNKKNPHGVTIAQIGAAAASHTHKVDEIVDFPTSMPANGGNADTVGGKSPDDLVLAADYNNAIAELKNYIDRMDIINAKPKVGYHDDDCYANIFGSFPFSSRAYSPVYRSTDNMAREVLYFSGNNGVDTTPQVYLAYRMNDSQDFSFLPEPLRPSHLNSEEVMDKVLGLGSEWIIYVVRNTTTDNYQTWFSKTDGSSLASDWYDHKNIESIIDDTSTLWRRNIPTYLPDQNVFIVAKTASLKISITVYDYDLNMIKESALVDSIVDMIDYTGTVQHDSPLWRGRPGMYYNSNEKQLNMAQHQKRHLTHKKTKNN